MPDNYYDDGPGAAAAAPAPDKDGPPPKDEQTSNEQTALLPKTILGGKEFNVGDEVVLKVTAIHEDSVQVEYAQDKPEEGEGEAPPQEGAAPPPGDAEMAGYMQ